MMSHFAYLSDNDFSNYDIQGQISTKSEQSLPLPTKDASVLTTPSIDKPIIPATMPSVSSDQLTNNLKTIIVGPLQQAKAANAVMSQEEKPLNVEPYFRGDLHF